MVRFVEVVKGWQQEGSRTMKRDSKPRCSIINLRALIAQSLCNTDDHTQAASTVNNFAKASRSLRFGRDDKCGDSPLGSQ